MGGDTVGTLTPDGKTKSSNKPVPRDDTVAADEVLEEAVPVGDGELDCVIAADADDDAECVDVVLFLADAVLLRLARALALKLVVAVALDVLESAADAENIAEGETVDLGVVDLAEDLIALTVADGVADGVDTCDVPTVAVAEDVPVAVRDRNAVREPDDDADGEKVAEMDASGDRDAAPDLVLVAVTEDDCEPDADPVDEGVAVALAVVDIAPETVAEAVVVTDLPLLRDDEGVGVSERVEKGDAESDGIVETEGVLKGLLELIVLDVGDTVVVVDAVRLADSVAAEEQVADVGMLPVARLDAVFVNKAERVTRAVLVTLTVPVCDAAVDGVALLETDAEEDAEPVGAPNSETAAETVSSIVGVWVTEDVAVSGPIVAGHADCEVVGDEERDKYGVLEAVDVADMTEGVADVVDVTAVLNEREGDGVCDPVTYGDELAV